MLAVSGGRIILLSTPFGKRGFFYKEWSEGGAEWRRVKITANDCPRISKDWLEQERRTIGDWWFSQEYLCEFVDSVDQVFATSDIMRALDPEVKPLFCVCVMGDWSYFIGLDLGQAKDFTALAILEQHGQFDDAICHARHLQRYQLGTPYPAIVADVGQILQREPLCNHNLTLAIDGTGVGAAVVDMFLQADLRANLHPITITGGDQVTRDGLAYRVPKRDLVGVVQVCLQTSRLKIASALPEAATLTAELQNFQVKISESAHDSYGSWRGGTHDDLVLALALALWSANRIRPFMWV
jgi:hypothetical protein